MIKNKLKKLIYERYKTVNNFCFENNLNKSLIYKKLNGVIKFNENDIYILMKILNIDKKDIFEYFIEERKEVVKNEKKEF
ncbi:DUF739 family protein [Streptobacillus moniliformis]|uniref:DUF739 family protein n=1 Tax=Streptobacillus moniliformis TaxID=34105 RepID=UPI0007E34250|nr:DUF739 family protein [Streptobacillus moniliformis]